MELTWKKINKENLITGTNIKRPNNDMEYKMIEFIKNNGIMKNLIVSEVSKDKYIIIDGNKIFKYATAAGVSDFYCCLVPAKDIVFIQVMLNTLNHNNDLVELSELIRKLSPNELNKLPFSKDMIETFQSLLTFNWNQYHVTQKNKDQGSLF